MAHQDGYHPEKSKGVGFRVALWRRSTMAAEIRHHMNVDLEVRIALHLLSGQGTWTAGMKHGHD
jgi:hypothetical protein